MIKTFLIVMAVLAFLWTPLGRSAEGASVTGKWHFVFDTQGGDREFDAMFEQTAEKVGGKWGISETRKDGDPVAGTFSGKDLNLEFPANSDEVGPGTMKIKGQLADDGTLTGTWGFQDYSGTFKATRAKSESTK